MTTENSTPLIPGYQIREQLYAGSRTQVYRAIREQDSRAVVIKLLTSEYPTFNELLQFRNQYTITKNLNIPGIIHPLSLDTCGNSYILVMEDTGKVSLQEYITTHSLSLVEFLSIAIQLTDILYHLYQNRAIHKDIKPANILIHPETKQVELIDFSLASLLPKETQQIKNPNSLEGTLAYIPPEQTGRMNRRGIDYRSDFYSLGVTFFEILTTELPFICDDPMELLHCHIAQQPPYVSDIKSEIPQVISEIIGKLMAKNTEDRYQSALGLKHDLETCLYQLKDTGEIKDFEIGKRDICDRFIIPEKLYGRDREVQTLLKAFDRVCGVGNRENNPTPSRSELMLVAGFSGIGKTAVVSEIHKSIVKQRGYFIKGKFDQFNRNIPFSAFVQAFRNLMGQLLSEADTRLSSDKNKILQVLGDNAQVIIDVIPELEQIIGKQPPASELSGTAAQNRFNLLFQNFIQVFTTKENPLVIFLDDLQWADSASLKLMQLLMGELQTGYLLMIGAYRDNEVFPAHPLILTLGELEKTGAIINTINLELLNKASLTQLVADTLSCSTEIAQPLTDIVYQKTQGNPFFVTQFLKALHQDGLIYFDARLGHWECDITKVREAGLTDDVVEFMTTQLQKLPTATQNILKLAACIGHQFDLKTLTIISEESEVDAAKILWKALQSELVLPQSQVYKFYLGDREQDANPSNIETVAYRFVHDRVQQAAYSLIPEDQKQQTHLKIGQLLLQGLSEQEQIEQIFDLVNQLNLGQAAIACYEEKQQLARLNLQAGQKAKLSAAYQAASNYYTTGINLLSANTWQTNYELIYNLHRYASEAEYLCGNFERAESLYRQTLQNAQTPLDKAVIHRVQMTQYQLQGRNTEVISIQRLSLQLLGWEIPTEEELISASLDEEIATVKRFLEQHSVESILHLPKMEDDTIAEILRILQILFYAAWLDGKPTLALLALAKMTTLSLQYGNSDMSPFGYVGYGLIANTMLKEFRTAYQFGEMAVRLCEHFDNADVRGMTNFLFAADVHSWSRSIGEADTYYNNAYKYGMEAGNWLTVSFMMMQSGSDRLTYGRNLDELYAIAQAHADFLDRIKSLENLDALIVGVIQPIRNLLGLTKTPLSFDDENFSESEYLQKYANVPYHLAWLYSVKIRHAYLFDHKVAYPDLIPQLSVIENTISSHAKVPSSVFYVALMHLSLAEIQSEARESQVHLEALVPLEEKLNYWQTACPENILHKCLLIQAEKARIDGQKIEAIDLYEQAIATARANEYGYEEALANELTAKFYLNWGKEKAAQAYMQEAYYCYARWGAKAKTDDLEQRYPNLLRPILQQATQKLNTLETLTAIALPNISIHDSTKVNPSCSISLNTALDFTTILKASQTLSSTIQLDELLRQFTQIILQNSGGDHCALILPNSDGAWFVEAIADADTTELCSQPLDDNPNVPIKLIQYVKNTQEVVAIDNLDTNLPVIGKYLSLHQPKSVLCLPILDRGDLIGVIYLKNQSTSGVFTSDRILILNFLSTQAAISLENARLFREREKAEAQLRTTNEELIRATRLKDEFLATMSHELRTPLNAILGMTEGLQEEIFGEINDKQLKALQTIERSGSHLLELINDILDVAKIESSQMELDITSTPVIPLCQSSLAFIKQQAEKKNLQLETKLPLNLPDLFVDERRIRQVLINLLNNAVKFTPDGGSISLEVSHQQQPMKSDVGNPSPGNFLRIAVIDTGIGIAPEDINKLFKPFIQIDSALNRQYAGTGLGLTLVKRIVEHHGGQVEVISELGVGSCFTIYLPCDTSTTFSSESQIQPQLTIESNSPQKEVSPLILLVEDNEANISTVSSYLGAKGYRIVLAKNGHEAVKNAQSQAPDLILMDIQMPQMDGVEAIEQIRSLPNFSNVPIIALTALAMKGDRERCLAAGADDYLSKPVKLKQLTATIQQFLTA